MIAKLKKWAFLWKLKRMRHPISDLSSEDIAKAIIVLQSTQVDFIHSLINVKIDKTGMPVAGLTDEMIKQIHYADLSSLLIQTYLTRLLDERGLAIIDNRLVHTSDLENMSEGE